MKKNKDIRLHNVPIYNYGLIFVNRTKKRYSSEEIYGILKKEGYDVAEIKGCDFKDTSIATTYYISNLRGLVIINKKVMPETIAHECVHLTSHLFESIGSPHTMDTDENYAYILGNFVSLLDDFCIDRKIKA